MDLKRHNILYVLLGLMSSCIDISVDEDIRGVWRSNAEISLEKNEGLSESTVEFLTEDTLNVNFLITDEFFYIFHLSNRNYDYGNILSDNEVVEDDDLFFLIKFKIKSFLVSNRKYEIEIHESLFDPVVEVTLNFDGAAGDKCFYIEGSTIATSENFKEYYCKIEN